MASKATIAKVVAIHVTDRGSGAMRVIQSTRAVKGRGIEGDRYYAATGTYTGRPGSGRQVTLIESEAIRAVAKDYRIRVAAKDTRRNLLTQGVALNHLVGRTFRVGGATLRGTRLCEPCNHLESLTCKGIRAAFVHRGGLRADIVRSGVIRAGDSIRI